MKKLFFTLAILLSAITVNAQDVGKFWAGGHIGFSSSKPKGGDATTSFTIMPELGYVLQENLGIGVNLGYEHIKTGDVKFDGFKIAPFVRYSFLKGDIGGLFVDGGVGYTHGKDKVGSISVKTDEFEVGFRPGVAINVSDRVALTAKYGFVGYQYEKAGDKKINTFAADFKFNECLFGVSFVF